MARYTPMIEQYLSIKNKNQDAFLFFRLGDFYELFFEDAEKASKILEITLTARDGGASEKIPMCGVPFHSASAYIEKLVAAGHKVAICEQVENPKQAKGVVRREVIRVITPGTVMEENMLLATENHFLTALYQEGSSYGIAAVDLSTGECFLSELHQTLPAVLDEIATFEPKELVVVHELATNSLLHDECKRLGIVVSEFDDIDTVSSLEEQFPNVHEVCNTSVLLGTLHYVYQYLLQTQKRSLGHLKRLRRYHAHSYMLLDEVARRNLELTRSLQNEKRTGSLLAHLDHTATAMGSRMLKQWLDKPLLSKKEIMHRQNIVSQFIDEMILLEELTDHLKRVYDLERLAARVSFGSASPRDLYQLRKSLEEIPTIKEKLASFSSDVLHRLADSLDPCQGVQALIASAIVDDPPISLKDGGVIREGYHEELDKLRHIQSNGKGWIAKLEEQERKRTGIKSLKVGYNRIFGYYLEITKSNLHLVPEEGYIRKQTLANAERFITADLKEQEQLILHANERSLELEMETLKQVRDTISNEVVRLQNLAAKIAEIDVLHAYATVSIRYQYTRPIITESDRFYVQKGRHPVVEAAQYETYVANDIHLDSDTRQVLMITGPNMAGKSTYMRQVALIAIMAQIGCFVPAEKAEVGLIDRIFTRIGASDDLAQGHSTFMVEMMETCEALQEATPKSLILLDEVGRGTSTYDGMALAHAIVEYVHEEVGAKTLFSTHYHELTKLESELPKLKNVHAKCVEKDGKVVFLHRIVPGGADRSYGIHVAELAGLPAPVIDRAKEILTHLEESNTSEVAVAKEEEPLTLFSFLPEVSPIEEEITKELRAWDLLEHTPMESLQFLQTLQQKLKSK
ncbi:DNA mismatch repair protein MutS [Shimazuella sp. AN120528]|uniref:DNA mismatch repair protein MutS n=1 Tax=Shimazuella soli TaxID=1892854 RepID=UPI001F0EE7C7|nr:DNA mismatch repair protein MutS [Shimazuella soli]MCH5586398.1 DNA mismatch repair protein MutS [Shimazuella soli]